MGSTAKRGLRYPEATALANTLHTQIKNLADDTDFLVDYTSIPGTGNMQRINNVAMFQESGSNLTGYIVVQTNFTFVDVMTRLHITGWCYQLKNNVIDITATFYPYSGSGNTEYVDIINNGSMNMQFVALYKRNSDNKVAIVMFPDTASNYWQYPKLVVDAMTGHSFQDPAVFKTGWSISRQTSLGAYTLLSSPSAAVKKWALAEDTGWINATLLNGWTNYASGFALGGYRRKAGVVYLQGLLVNGAPPGGGAIFQLPPGYRPAATHLCVNYNNGGAGRFDIDSGGNVSYQLGAAGWYSIAGVSFPCDQ